jgi:hypothetical protein
MEEGTVRRCLVRNLVIGILHVVVVLAIVACGPKNQASGRLVNLDEYGHEEDPVDSLNKEVNQALATGGPEEGTTGGAGDTGTPTGTSDAGQGTTKPKSTGTGPGQILITCKCMEKEVPCDVEILDNVDLSKKAAGKDSTKHSFSINPGEYRIELWFHEAVNIPKLTLQNITVGPGETVERVVNFPMAQVKFVPVKSGGGGKVAGWKLRIRLKGADDWANTNVKLNEYVYMSPGMYEGQLYKGNTKKEVTIDISTIQINEGAKSQVPIYVSH